MANEVKTFSGIAAASVKTLCGVAVVSVKTWNGVPLVATYLPSDNPTSLVAWFRKGVGITESGGFASAWADQSGNGNNLLQATGTNQPAYSAGELTFDGVDNFLKATIASISQPQTEAMSVKQTTWTLNDVLISGNSTQPQIYQSPTTPSLRLWAGSSEVAANSNASLGAWHAVTALFSGASSSLLVDATTPTTGNPGTGALVNCFLGWAGTGGGYSNIVVRELIIRNVNDATIRQNDHDYLLTL